MTADCCCSATWGTTDLVTSSRPSHPSPAPPPWCRPRPSRYPCPSPSHPREPPSCRPSRRSTPPLPQRLHTPPSPPPPPRPPRKSGPSRTSSNRCVRQVVLILVLYTELGLRGGITQDYNKSTRQVISYLFLDTDLRENSSSSKIRMLLNIYGFQIFYSI